jgi:hypothetical protein
MSKCSNCGTRITCGCQKRVAKDGTSCCTKCVSKYETESKGLIKVIK